MSGEADDGPRPLSERVFIRMEVIAARSGNVGVPYDAPQLVAFRCGRAGHFLGAIYGVAEGPIFIGGGRETDLSLRRYKAARKDELAPELRKSARQPSPRMPTIDEAASDIPAPISCRCGAGPALSRRSLLWSLERSRGAKSTVVVRVEHDELYAGGVTLSL